MKLDLNKVLDIEGEVDVVTTDVDLRECRYRGVSPFNQPAAMTARASNRAGVVTLDCTYSYTLCLTCDRCLKPFTNVVEQKAAHIVVRQLNGIDDEEFVVVPDGIVELLELATNDIVLELPGKFLCREDCKGLCPKCGCDLNQHSCGCDTRQTDPRLAALDKFFED